MAACVYTHEGCRVSACCVPGLVVWLCTQDAELGWPGISVPVPVASPCQFQALSRLSTHLCPLSTCFSLPSPWLPGQPLWKPSYLPDGILAQR